jgi:pseudouridine synthase
VLDKEPDELFLQTFRKGVLIGAYITKPCMCDLINATTIKVVLREGKNRQIRNMCKTLGYSVLNLTRVRIDQIRLDNLRPGEKEKINIALTG